MALALAGRKTNPLAIWRAYTIIWKSCDDWQNSCGRNYIGKVKGILHEDVPAISGICPTFLPHHKCRNADRRFENARALRQSSDCVQIVYSVLFEAWLSKKIIGGHKRAKPPLLFTAWRSIFRRDIDCGTFQKWARREARCYLSLATSCLGFYIEQI